MNPQRLLLFFICLLVHPGRALAQLGPAPAYPKVHPIAIGRTLRIDGVPHRLWYFLTPDPLSDVARHFRDFWREQGYPVTLDGDFETQLVVSAFDTRMGLQHAVVLSRSGDRTLGFNVIRDLWALAEATRAPELLPPLEGTLFAGQTRDPDSKVDAHVRSAVLSGGLEEARRTVRHALERAGYAFRGERRQTVDGRTQVLLDHGREGGTVFTTLVETSSDVTAIFQTVAREGPTP